MAAEKAWLKAFSSGSKALQDRLRKVHAKNPEFQSFLGKHGFEGGSSVKQASKAQTVSKEVAAKRTELSDKAYGATTGAKVGGDHVELKDTIAPLTKDQHSKVQVAKKAALSKDERIAAIARASRKASTKYDIPTEDRDDVGHEDLRDLHHSLHIGHGSSLDEEAQKHRIEVTMSNPNHPAVTKRDERFSRVVRVTASNPEKALHAGWDHYKKKGYRVHEAEHIGMIEEQVDQLDEATKRAINITPEDLEVIKSGDHETVKKHMAKLVARAADTKLNKRPLRSDKANEFLSNIHSSTNVGQLQKMAYNMYLGGDDAGKSKYGSLHVYNPQSKMGRSYQRRYGISEASLDEATKAYKDPITGQVTQIPAHKAPTYGFNKFGQFASLDRVPKPRNKLHNAAHHLMRSVHDFEEGTPERQAVTDALKKVVGAIKEEKVEEAHIDPNFVATFGVAAAAYDHVLNPLLKKAKQKIADKMAEKLGKKKEAPAEQVAEASLEETNFKYDVDHMPGQTVRGTLPKSCPTCYGRKSMYVTPKGEMYADKKTENSKKVACPDCEGKGYVAEESNEDSNYLNNKKNQIRESIQSKLAAKTGKK